MLECCGKAVAEAQKDIYRSRPERASDFSEMGFNNVYKKFISDPSSAYKGCDSEIDGKKLPSFLSLCPLIKVHSS